MLLKFYISKPVWAIFLHTILGIAARFFPQISVFYYIAIGVLGIIDIARSKDKSNIAAFYLIYITSFEIIYRIGKFYIFWELGKYMCIAIVLIALFSRQRPFKQVLPFSIFLLLLLPGILITLYYGHNDVAYLRELILYHITGPLVLGVMGMYFYKRLFTQEQVHQLLSLAVLPSVSLVVFLFSGQRVSEIDFISTSNYEASGGFGPNQVSTMIGWGIVLLIYGLVTKKILTINRITDIILLLLLLFRGLLTFSRGGMIAALFAATAAIFIVILQSRSYQRNIGKLGVRLLFAFIIFIPVLLWVNRLTGNYLLYRYQGKDTNEVLTGRPTNRTYLSGREQVLSWELEAFTKYPFLGVGAGRGTLFRLENYGKLFSSHTEQTRLLGEHGLFGLVILLFYFIYLPIWFIRKLRYGENKHWSAQFYFLTMLTMFHAGMRLAMPALAFAISFILIIPEKSSKKGHENPPLPGQPAFQSRHYAHHD